MEAYLWKEAFLGKGMRPENNESENDSDENETENNEDSEENEENEDDSMSDENVDEDVFTQKDKLAWLGLRFNFESSSFEQISGRLGGGNHWAVGQPNLTRKADEKFLCAAADYANANKTEWRMVSCNLTLPISRRSRRLQKLLAGCLYFRSSALERISISRETHSANLPRGI
ncbi:unnamed protein product [Oikopleura dioica]|uniref:Uncharacterized protein n=1 Tax=Oikopleura dioica TaxID=34765 RepID=E4Y069_OIKDI|nr:unnamed protein product [Oikopleura dioica]